MKVSRFGSWWIHNLGFVMLLLSSGVFRSVRKALCFTTFVVGVKSLSEGCTGPSPRPGHMLVTMCDSDRTPPSALSFALQLKSDNTLRHHEWSLDWGHDTSDLCLHIMMTTNVCGRLGLASSESYSWLSENDWNQDEVTPCTEEVYI